MDMMTERRLGSVERRLKRLEEWVQLPAEEPLQGAKTPIQAAPLPQPVLPPPPPLVPVVEVVESNVSPPPPVQIAYRTAPAPRQVAARSGALEQAIGLKWAGWVGAIVLVIGAGLGIKFAYVSGWFGAIPAGLKLALLSLAGFALIGTGEWVYRRVNQLSAVGLFGAGVALLFIDSYAGFRYYNLYARDTAFVLMGISTLCGALVAMRARLVSIGVLSLLGGHLAPVLLAGPTPNLPTFFAYLLALQCVALFLAWWGGEAKWWTLRGLVLLGNALWVMALPTAAAVAAETVFLVVSAALFQIELIASAPLSKTERSPGAMFGTWVTAGLTAGLLMVLRQASDAERAMWVIGLSGACAALGFGLPRRRAGWEALRIAYRIQACGLAVVAVPIWFSGINVEIGWACVALAFAALAAANDLPISRAAAVMTWCLAVGHLDLRAGRTLGTSGVPIFETEVPTWAIEVGGLALIAQVIAWFCGKTKRESERISRLASVMGSLVFLWAALAGLPPLGATFAIAAYAWVLLGMDKLQPRTAGLVQAVTAVMLAMVKWVVIDLLAERFSPRWPAAQYAAVLNPAMAIGGFISLTLVGMGWLERDRLLQLLRRWGAGPEAGRRAVLMMAAIVIGLMTIGLSFEVDRVVERGVWTGGVNVWPMGQLKQLLWTLLWSTACAGFLGLVRQVEPCGDLRLGWVRAVGRMAVALAVKFILVDAIGYRFGAGAALAPVILNVQMVAALALIGALAAVFMLSDAGQLKRTISMLCVLVLLVTGAMEIDRAFELMAAGPARRAGTDLGKQVALSIYGAVFAISAVTAGFRRPSASARYFGLALFGLTLAKVVVVDLQNAGQGYRVLSFIGVGILLLGTSVLYGKLSPKLLAREEVNPQAT